MGKLEIRPLATPKPLNRSSPNVAYMIKSWISTYTQNLVMIPKGFLFHICVRLRIKDVYSASFWGVLQTLHSQGPQTDFHA